MTTEKAKVFLCYARKDSDRVEKLYQKLLEAHFTPWMDTKDILPGEDWKRALIKAIREAPFFLACMSNNSVNRRGVVQEEIKEALEIWRQKLESDIYFIPVRLEECQVPEALSRFQWVDLFSENDLKGLLNGLNVGMERLGIRRPISLRSQPIKSFSEGDMKKMLQTKDFFNVVDHWTGKGIQHQYEVEGHQGKRVVFDRTTGLTWQQSGSEAMTFAKVQNYINNLCSKENLIRAALQGPLSPLDILDDWRLPTLEEAMSLMEATKNKEGLYIAATFDATQEGIWTSDQPDAEGAWAVDFSTGYCAVYDVYGILAYARVVRSPQ